MFHGLARDLFQAVRRLAATPLFTLFAILSLAVGLAVTTAVYSVVDAVLLRGLGIRAPADVVFLVTPGSGRLRVGQISQPDFDDLVARQTSFGGVAGSRGSYLPMTFPGATEITSGEAVNGSYFSTLGVRPALGRTILPSDDEGDALVVVLSHSLWRARFGANPDIVGQAVRMAGQMVEVIGVADESFKGPLGHYMSDSRFWIPLGAERILQPSAPATRRGDDRNLPAMTVLGRLAPGRTEAQASAELSRVAAHLDASHPLRALWAPEQTAPRGWAARRVDVVNDEANLNGTPRFSRRPSRPGCRSDPREAAWEP